jgi:hypothetical protein
MKTLSDFVQEEVSTSIGDMIDRSNFATPGNTMGMGDLKPPTYKDPGSDVFGTTRKEKKKKQKCEEKTD